MALTDKLKAIADAIRGKTGITSTMTLDEMAEAIEFMEVGVTTYDANTYVLIDEDGNNIPAVLTEEEVELTATTNDIRLGSTAVTDDGIVTGEKEIPAYYVTEGMKVVTAGSNFEITGLGEACNYTKLQALICANSVSTEKVAINNKVYAANSTTALSEVTVDSDKQSINLGIVNESSNIYLIRYFTYKEEY